MQWSPEFSSFRVKTETTAIIAKLYYRPHVNQKLRGSSSLCVKHPKWAVQQKFWQQWSTRTFCDHLYVGVLSHTVASSHAWFLNIWNVANDSEEPRKSQHCQMSLGGSWEPPAENHGASSCCIGQHGSRMCLTCTWHFGWEKELTPILY